MAKILSISRDLNLLRTREMMLSQLGHDTTSVINVERAFQLMTERKFDLVILGHSLLPEEKISVGNQVRDSIGCPVLELTATGTPYSEGAVTIEPFNPELFILTIQKLTAGDEQSTGVGK